MKIYRTAISAAEEFTAEDALKDSMHALEDDFEFLLAGIEKISRNDIDAGQEIVVEVSDALQSAITKLASQLQEVE